ncbi:helix-turn-helix domain-containing protein [Zhihengliuella alba]|uniref:Helix-turn-helix domain-containing protein n=2 Tax=Zhihengliuella alba TaxID=547018 RepID=A0ABP7CMG3_9MICC
MHTDPQVSGRLRTSDPPSPQGSPATNMSSTSSVAQPDAFAYWEELISQTFVPLSAKPIKEKKFVGRIQHSTIDAIGFSDVRASSQAVRRTPGLIAQCDNEFLLASIQISGSGRVEQDDRTALLSPGEMAFYDSSRPYALQFDRPFAQLVIQIPRDALSIKETRQFTARTLGRGTPAAAVVPFLRSLSGTASTNTQAALMLAPQTLGLVEAVASFASGLKPPAGALEAAARQRVADFLRRNLADPDIDAESVAKACNVSRRTLYRIVGDQGIAYQLRRLRIERARQLLIAEPERPVGSIASACGFESESGFYRAFRAVTAVTPAEYRRDSGTSRQ